MRWCMVLTCSELQLLRLAIQQLSEASGQSRARVRGQAKPEMRPMTIHGRGRNERLGLDNRDSECVTCTRHHDCANCPLCVLLPLTVVLLFSLFTRSSRAHFLATCGYNKGPEQRERLECRRNRYSAVSPSSRVFFAYCGVED